MGVVAANIASGAVSQVIVGGLVMTTSGLDLFWSGQAGKTLLAGSGGCVVAAGLMVSGQTWHRLGVAVSGGIIVQPALSMTSGAVATPAGTF
mgnify:CR=1 FL=1